MKTLNKVALFSLATLLAGAASAVSNPTLKTVVTGLSAPRGLDVDSKGNLYIAQSGYGNPNDPHPFALSRSSIVGPICVGNTAKVSEFTLSKSKPQLIDLVSNLPSQANCGPFNGAFIGVPLDIETGAQAFGVAALQVIENGNQTGNNQGSNIDLLATFGGSTELVPEMCFPGGVSVATDSNGVQSIVCAAGFSPSNPSDMVSALNNLWGSNTNVFTTFGHFNLGATNPQYQVLSNEMKTFEQTYHPDWINTADKTPNHLENDPVDILHVGKETLIADAGANTIWTKPDNGGPLGLVAVLPLVGCAATPCTTSNSGGQESVPTTIARNPVTGRIYVGEYAGGFSPSRIFEVDRSTAPATLRQVAISGPAIFANVAMRFDAKGNLYVVAYDNMPFNGSFANLADGALLKLTFSNPWTATQSVVDDQNLVAPYGIAIDNNAKKIYISQDADVGPGLGKIVSFNLP